MIEVNQMIKLHSISKGGKRNWEKKIFQISRNLMYVTTVQVVNYMLYFRRPMYPHWFSKAMKVERYHNVTPSYLNKTQIVEAKSEV